MLSLVITTAFAAVFPAVGPIPYFLNEELNYVRVVMALRDGTVSSSSLRHMEGVVTMPSYHTTLGILFVYAHPLRPAHSRQWRC